MFNNKIKDPNKSYKNLKLPLFVFLFVFAMLAMVQIKMAGKPIILLERFFKSGGWFEIPLIAFYGAFLAFKMQNPLNVPKWRRISWTVFSVVFFSQLIIGLIGETRFLMTGKLHLPIPVMILAGPIYRGQLSVMTILFLSTIILTGPAWCSQLCYFGAFDGLASKGKTDRKILKNKFRIKFTIILIVIAATIVLRWFEVPVIIATLLAIGFGVAGILVMIFFSRRQGKMVHCTLYCPIGTIVNIAKPVNPFRMYIDTTCTMCMRCTVSCKYDALNLQDLKNKRPGITCTYCGDCLATCRDNSIKYKFLRLSPKTSRNLYLFLTLSIHAVFLALARI